MNNVLLFGRVGKDPEIKSFDWGKTATFSLATSAKWKNKDGEKQERTEWHNVKATGAVVGVIEKYVHKGDQLGLTGEIRYNKSEKDGVTKYFTEIHLQNLELLGSKEPKEATKPEPIEESPDLPF